MLQKGDLIGGEYKVYKICEGGMGVVYICQHTSNQGVYALKTFKDNEYSLASYAQDLFEKEAIIWVKMGWFPYIVKAVAVERLDKKVYVILEYINPDLNGRNTLADYIGNQTEKESIDISLQVCYGMEYAFTKGLQAHRDLKPNNIMMTSDGTVKIADFGLARMYQAVYERKQRYPNKVDDKACLFFKSSSGHACGTPPYMAPEQFGGDADQRSDIYSFGIILYEMTGNGYPPFVSRNIEDYERLHKYDKINSLSTPLFPIIQKMLRKKSSSTISNLLRS